MVTSARDATWLHGSKNLLSKRQRWFPEKLPSQQPSIFRGYVKLPGVYSECLGFFHTIRNLSQGHDGSVYIDDDGLTIKDSRNPGISMVWGGDLPEVST